jgi:hypothetical protein
MTQTITANTTRDSIITHLDAAGVSYELEPQWRRYAGVPVLRGEIIIGSLLVYWDEGDCDAIGWAWRDRIDSGSLDSFAELDSLVADAIKAGERVIAGRGGPDEDTGIVHGFDGRMADVAFDSGVRVNVPVEDIESA